LSFPRDYPTLEKFFHSANTLIAHFHFVCNGSALFQRKWQARNQRLDTTLRKGQLEYMKEMNDVLEAKGTLPVLARMYFFL
jgi:hypothetical protein